MQICYQHRQTCSEAGPWNRTDQDRLHLHPQRRHAEEDKQLAHMWPPRLQTEANDDSPSYSPVAKMKALII